MSKYTRGPWIVWADTNLIIRLHSGAAKSEDLRICEVSTNTRNDEGRYNGILIAAAPTLAQELNHAATLLALAADKVRTVDFEGDRFDLLAEAERFDALLAKVAA